MTEDDPRLRSWTVERSRVLLEDRWLRVRADDCRTADGTAIAPYYVLDYPDWVLVAALTDADELVMVRQYRHARGIVSLELPTGGIDAGEGVIAAGRRELAEETGYSAGDWRLLASLAPNPSTQSNLCHVVLATGARLASAPRDDPAEPLATRLMPVDAVAAAARGGGVIQAMHVAALAIVLGAMGRW